jgi:hypothetical protein
MQPNEPASPTPDYNFILNQGNNQPKRSILPGAGSSKKQRIIVVAAGGGILLLIIILISSLLFGGKKTPGLLDLAQIQQELIRVSTLGTQQASSSRARYLAITTELTVISNQNNLLAQMKKQGQKPNTKQLSLKQDKSTDAALTQATTDNRFDEVFIETVQKQLVAYQQQLRTVYTGTTSATLQRLLNEDFSQAGTLIASTKAS